MSAAYLGHMRSTPLCGLAAQLDSASGLPCSWILLHPTTQGHQQWWRSERNEVFTPALPATVAAAAAEIPRSGHPASMRAEWVRQLVVGLFGTGGSDEDCLVLPIWEKATVIGCVGWSGSRSHRHGEWLTRLPKVRSVFRQVRALNRSREECRALRWLLGRGDQALALANPHGDLLAVTLSAREILQSLRFGVRHFFRADAPMLPSSLVRMMTQTPAGQVKLSASCTARFSPVPWSGAPWLPLASVEFFVETTGPRSPLALSRLTAVERDVCRGLVQGMTNRQIATARGTAFATIKNQVSQILCKSGVSRRIELAAALSGQARIDGISAQAGAGGISRTM